MKLRTILIAVNLILFSANSFSQETCATAVPLIFNGPCVAGTNTGANITGDGVASEPACWSGGPTDWNESVWYSVTLSGVAPEDELVASVLEGTLSSGNTAMQIYSGTCGSLTEIGCVLGGASVSATGLSAGTYYIMLDGVGGQDGDFCISVSELPANDDICDAVTISTGEGCTTGTNAGSTAEGGDVDPSCVNGPANTLNTVWYEFTATDDSITVNFGDGTLISTLIASVYSSSDLSCTGTMTEVGCTSNGSEIDLTLLNVGDTYYIMVDGKTTDMGTFCISVYETPPPPPILGTCLNPRSLFPGSDCNDIQGRQYDEANNYISEQGGGADAGGAMATIADFEGSCTGTDIGQNAYWVEFDTGNNTTVTFDNAGGTALNYSVYGGDCTTMTEVDCVTAAAAGSTTVSGLVADSVYLVMITGSGTNDPTTAFLCITASNIYVPANDDCADATALSTSTNYELNNANATVDANNTLCSGSTENNVWVVWTADFTGTAYVNLQNQDCIASNGMQMSIFEPSASCPNNSSTCIAYINPNNDNDFFGDFAVTSGETFYIQLDGFAGTGCEFDFCITSSANPDCATITPLGLVENKFNAELNNAVVDLSWEIIDEYYTPSYFVVEKSQNSIDFTEVGKVKESIGNMKYLTHDFNPNEGVSYYRLKHVSTTGSISYSQIKAISFDVDLINTLTIIPNPASDNLMLNFESELGEEAHLEIFNIAGKLIHAETIETNRGFNRVDLDITSFNKGTYIVSIIKDDIRIQERLVKQ